MRSKLLLPFAVLIALAIPATALADDPPVPPAFAPPVAGPVTDVTSAENFADGYVNRNASRFLNQDRRRVRVVDVASACLQSPILTSRFGCVFTLRALVIDRSRGWDRWHSLKGGHKPEPRPRPRVRIRNFGCLGFLRINGGPAVRPSAQLIQVECGRVPRGDIVAPEPL